MSQGEWLDMTTDPRFLNEKYDTSSIGAYLLSYADRLKVALQSVDASELQRAKDLIEETARNGGSVQVIGNGGSAAIADHLCCDWTKGTHVQGHPTIKSYSMTSNVALYSAIANDYGFEKVFSTQIGFNAHKGDLLIAISSSGNSPNILAGVEEAKRIGLKSISLSGFSGGKLKTACDVSLYVAANNYGVVEDAHQAIMHILAQMIAHDRDASKA
jgi:D-sedoheptulose 7-phosphate isomerase